MLILSRIAFSHSNAGHNARVAEEALSAKRRQIGIGDARHSVRKEVFE
jgi:hypothetical protein